MDGKRNNGLIIVISLLVGVAYWGTTQYFGSDDEESTETAQVAGGETQQASDQGNTNGGATGPAGQVSDHGGPTVGQLSESERDARQQTLTLRGESFQAIVDNFGGGLSSFELLGDPRFTDEEGQPLQLLDTEFNQYQALRIGLEGLGLPADPLWELEQRSESEISLTWEGSDLRIVRTLSAGEGPFQVWSTTRVINTSEESRPSRFSLSTHHYVDREQESGGLIASRSPYISQGTCAFGEDNEVERKDRKALTEDGVHGYGANNVHFAAVEDVYFVQAMAAHGEEASRCAISAIDWRVPGQEDPTGTLFQAQLMYDWETIEPGAERIYTTLNYLGPKDPHALLAAGHQLPQVVNLGFFAMIAGQLAKLLSFIQSLVGNWGVAIILLTLLIRVTLFPLTNMSFSSMAKMRRVKPEIDRLNALYADDAEKKGAATMDLYRKHKINPLAGCLPSLMQMPVWFALYTSLSTNIELYHMPFALWWTDLSAPDPYFILPLCLGALMHLQQRLTPAAMDATQAKMMMWMMPIMITVFMLFLPSGLCLYMLTNSALGIGQQKLNEHRLDKEMAAISEEETDGEPDDSTDDPTQDPKATDNRRRPKRKRRVRRGQA